MPTSLSDHFQTYADRFASFGWHTFIVDGHNVAEIQKAFQEARQVKDKPTAIISKSHKGKYFLGDIDDQLNWHGKPITKESKQISESIRKLIKVSDTLYSSHVPKFQHKWAEEVTNANYKLTLNYDKSKQVSTREAYGQALKKLGALDKQDHVIALDCDVKNSTMSEYYEKEHPHKFINCFIAEQNMVSLALGVSKRNKIPFCSTFAAFYTRAFDHIRMAAISFANVKFFGSHSGVHIGPDGPSQMALEVIFA